MMVPPIAEIRDVRFGYTWDVPVLDIPHLAIPKGKQILLSGASGSGKSTLLALISGIITAESGHVIVAGHDLGNMSGAKRDRFRANHLGVVFQQLNLLPFLSVRANVALGMHFSRAYSASLASSLDEEIVRMLSALELDAPSLLERKVGHLSVGQQQRVAAARALIGQPEILLADEPTSALDRRTAGSFLRLMFDECRRSNTTAIVVSHNESLRGLFDEVIDLKHINQASAGRSDA
ncbi:ATP-binding cassette domain-containing protein [Xanthomonas sp. 3498]|uniref:ABC transporter ATP-binding protein n=1 Tax=Xanthomonas sp. 3498 TaxID=2663863 RepID=UPI0016185871|nr:ATP-binding cassette domain-containing protein [Xanthomonas sp. 3498]MBB5876152.1 putative ABC transport system ATP-binding protein [Xanthomonas sp. 3498]